MFISVSAVAAKGFAAWLSVVSYCGTPVYVAGMDEEGHFISGRYKYILGDGRAAGLFAVISSQLPRNKDGEPIITQIKVESQLDLGCPVAA